VTTQEKALKSLGRQTVDILSGATKVEVFRIDGKGDRQPKPGEAAMLGNPVTARGKDQDEAFAKKLADVLLDDRTYTEEWAKCFRPGVAFRVWRGSDSVKVLVCFQCDNFYCGPPADRNATFHGSPQRPRLVRLAKEAFPEDPEIQALAEK